MQERYQKKKKKASCMLTFQIVGIDKMNLWKKKNREGFAEDLKALHYEINYFPAKEEMFKDSQECRTLRWHRSLPKQ